MVVLGNDRMKIDLDSLKRYVDPDIMNTKVTRYLNVTLEQCKEGDILRA